MSNPESRGVTSRAVATENEKLTYPVIQLPLEMTSSLSRVDELHNVSK